VVIEYKTEALVLVTRILTLEELRMRNPAKQGTRSSARVYNKQLA